MPTLGVFCGKVGRQGLEAAGWDQSLPSWRQWPIRAVLPRRVSIWARAHGGAPGGTIPSLKLQNGLGCCLWLYVAYTGLWLMLL